MIMSLQPMVRCAVTGVGVLALGTLGLLAGCGSAPVTTYYTLTPPPMPQSMQPLAAQQRSAQQQAGQQSQSQPQSQSQQQQQQQQQQPQAASSTSPWWIDVMPVGLPESLDQPQIVIRKSDSAVVVLEQARWSAPLSQELRSALSSQLSRQLGTQDVAGLSVPAGRDVLRIKVQMRRFEAWPAQQVHLAADWSMAQSSDTQRRVSCHTELTQPAGPDVSDIVQAQQRLVASLADAVAAVASRWPQGTCDTRSAQ